MVPVRGQLLPRSCARISAVVNDGEIDVSLTRVTLPSNVACTAQCTDPRAIDEARTEPTNSGLDPAFQRR